MKDLIKYRLLVLCATVVKTGKYIDYMNFFLDLIYYLYLNISFFEKECKYLNFKVIFYPKIKFTLFTFIVLNEILLRLFIFLNKST